MAVRFYKTREGVHVADINKEYTLCGDALEGDSFCDIEEAIAVPPQEITCPRCLTMIEHCKIVLAFMAAEAARKEE